MPVAKIVATPHLRLGVILSWRIAYIGTTRVAVSENSPNTALDRKAALVLMQLPGIGGSKSFSLGMHGKIVTQKIEK